MIQTDLIASIPVLLRRHAEARGSKVAYRDASRAVTYQELQTRTGNLAGHLADHGIRPSDKVAIFLPNSVAWIESCFAINRAGAISVPISYDATESEVLYRLQDAACTAIITTDERAALLAKLKNDAPALKIEVLSGPAAGSAAALRYEQLAGVAPKSAPRDPSEIFDPAFIIYTSGTTGRAKGVLLSVHSMLWVNAACWAPIVRSRCRSFSIAAVSFLCP